MLNIFKKSENKASPTACIFIGRSGCGKGTQVKLYIDKLKEVNGLKTFHLETGSFLRTFVKKSNYTANIVKNVIENGKLMPESTVIALWAGYLMENFTGKENMVFDGAPRRLCEATILNDTLKFYNLPKYKVIYVNASIKWCTEKLLARGRKDDTEEGVAKRMAWFEKDVMPCVEYFKNNEYCEFVDINGEQTIDQVHAEIMEKVFGK